MAARVQVHATFTVPEPVSLFVVAMEILRGEIKPGMFLRVPLNSMLDITSRIASVTDVTNSWGILLVGLVLCCEDEGIRQITETLNIGDEVLAVTSDDVDWLTYPGMDKYCATTDNPHSWRSTG